MWQEHEEMKKLFSDFIDRVKVNKNKTVRALPEQQPVILFRTAAYDNTQKGIESWEKNKLGFWSIVLLGINGIIGSGIFLLPNKAWH